MEKQCRAKPGTTPVIKKLDIYIIRTYLQTFFFTILLVTMVAVAIDLFENLDKFLSRELSLKALVFEYYLNFIPWINGQMWPLFSLIAVIFFTSRLAKQSEIIAVLSSGVSFYRLMVPFLIGGTIIASMHWVGSNHVIPKSTKKYNEFKAEYIRRSGKRVKSSNVHFFIGPDTKAYIRMYSARDSTARGFRLERFENGQVAEILKAKRIQFKNAPNTWTLQNYEHRSFDELKETIAVHDGEELDTVINITPKDFIRYTRQMEMMTTSELKEYVQVEKDRGVDTAKKYIMQLHKRNADPFTILILTIIGMTVAARKTRGGMGIHLAIGVVLGASYVILSKFSETFSTNLNMSPGLGIWIPNIIFILVAIYMVVKAQK